MRTESKDLLRNTWERSGGVGGKEIKMIEYWTPIAESEAKWAQIEGPFNKDYNLLLSITTSRR